jgi:hypothetical protein
MAKYDGLIIPRSYNDYINKSDPLGVSQALQLTGVMDDTPTAGSSKPVKSSGLAGLSAVDVVETGNMHPVTSNAVAKLFEVRSYTRISASEQLLPKNYNEFDIENTDLPVEIQGYKVVAYYARQSMEDAFLMQLHKSVWGKWRLTVFNCASVTQTIPDIIISVLFMKE